MTGTSDRPAPAAATLATDGAAARAIELLNELLSMKSSADGVPRSPIGVVGPKEGYDQIAQDAQRVALLIFAAQSAVPLMERLAALGRTLEGRGAISVEHGESYATKALDYLEHLARVG